MISPSQSRAARGLIGWSQTRLGEAASLSLPTVKRFEAGVRGRVSLEAIETIRAALQAAGIIFIPSNGNSPGVRLAALSTDAGVAVHLPDWQMKRCKPEFEVPSSRVAFWKTQPI